MKTIQSSGHGRAGVKRAELQQLSVTGAGSDNCTVTLNAPAAERGICGQPGQQQLRGHGASQRNRCIRSHDGQLYGDSRRGEHGSDCNLDRKRRRNSQDFRPATGVGYTDAWRKRWKHRVRERQCEHCIHADSDPFVDWNGSSDDYRSHRDRKWIHGLGSHFPADVEPESDRDA